MLALPAPEDWSKRTTSKAIVAVPLNSHQQASTSTKDIDSRSAKMQVESSKQPRDYNELMD